VHALRRLSQSMSYAQSVLQPGEKIVALGRLHWIIYRWAILSLIAGALLVWLEQSYWPTAQGLLASTAMIFGALFVATFVYAWFVRWITEFAITSHRVISSRVFIARKIEEMNMEKVETVDIHQSVLGRILGYGTLRITGTGGTNNIEESRVAQPFVLRNAISAK
jgi:uncharacterized membrane protein YdbT with pleckstrin-like domain